MMMMNKNMFAMRKFATSKNAGLVVARAALSTNSTETFTDRMKKTGRPIAPHVTHYAWPAAAISSITNRVTGGLLTVGISGMGILSLAGADVGSIMSSLATSDVGPIAKFCVTFPLAYHYLGGVRHMMWDFYPDLVNNEDVATSSYRLGAAALAISTGLAFTWIN